MIDTIKPGDRVRITSGERKSDREQSWTVREVTDRQAAIDNGAPSINEWRDNGATVIMRISVGRLVIDPEPRLTTAARLAEELAVARARILDLEATVAKETT